jgi:predicted amidohydrolase
MKTAICIFSMMYLAMSQVMAVESSIPMKRTMKIASLMYTPVKWDKEANKQWLDKEIRKAAQQGARMVVTPEGALEGYVVNLVRHATGEKRAALTAQFNQIAEPCNGPYIRHFQELTKELGIWLLLGFLEADGGNTYNTVVLLDPKGAIHGKYRKTHFAQGYRTGKKRKVNPTGYTRGGDYPVFEVDGINIGFMICFDRRVPKVAHWLAQNGAELIINPAYGMMGDKNRRFISGRSKENGIPVLFVHPRQTLLADKNGGISIDTRPKEDAVQLLDVTVPHVETILKTLPIAVERSKRKGFASITNRLHPNNRIGYRFFEHYPLLHGSIPKTAKTVGINLEAIESASKDISQRPGVVEYHRKIRGKKEWTDQKWSFYMAPTEDGLDMLWVVETGEKGLPSYHGVQQCFRMSGESNSAWRNEIAMTPAFSEYDLWKSLGSQKSTSLTWVLRETKWQSLLPVESCVGARTPYGVTVDKTRLGNLPDKVGPYEAKMLDAIDNGLIMRSNLDNTWVTGIYWERTSHVTNHHPADCLHSIVNIGNIPPNCKRAIRGKIYWFEGTKSDLLNHWRKDFGKTNDSEVQ